MGLVTSSGIALNDIYNSTELKTNKKLFGKEIYRKCLQFNSIETIVANIGSIDYMLKMVCYVYSANGWRSIPWLFNNGGSGYGSDSWAGGFYFYNDRIIFQLGADLSNIEKGIIILEYTKN